MAPEQVSKTLLDAVIVLARDLRAAGVDASSAEAIDGLRAVAHVGVGERQLVRVALQATLVKRAEDLGVFEALFERHFPRHPPPAATAVPPDSGAAIDGRDGGPASFAVAGMTAALVDAVRLGDAAALVQLADEAVARYSGIEARAGSERYFLYRVMRALDLSNLLIAVMTRQRSEHPDGSAFELRQLREDAQQRIEHLRQLLLASIRSRLALRAASTDTMTPLRRVEDVDVLAASTVELHALRSAVRPLARKLATRVGRQRRRNRHGSLDVRRTIRRSLDAGGIPLDPAWRRARRTKPRLVMLCDISGSVAEFANFTLMLLHAMHAELAGLRAFVFVDGVAEVTRVFEEAEVALDPRLLVAVPGVIAGDGHSDYSRALAAFVERHGEAVDAGTTVLVTGDARTNLRGSGVESLRAIRHRCRRLYWFNPEPAVEWDDPDSAVAEYRELCDGLFEVRNLTQLATAVAAIV
jgi:uncharacterized protein with von Willebrand factor type A (vWA) domain